jgi:hypothetical protein
VSAGRIAAHDRKIEILSDEKRCAVCADIRVGATGQLPPAKRVQSGARTALTFVHSVHETERYEHGLRVWASACALRATGD